MAVTEERGLNPTSALIWRLDGSFPDEPAFALRMAEAPKSSLSSYPDVGIYAKLLHTARSAAQSFRSHLHCGYIEGCVSCDG